MKTALFLIALGFGFKVFAEATANPKKSLKKLGRAVGATIMIMSAFGALYSLTMFAKYGRMNCFGLKGGMRCPFGMSAPILPSAPAK